MRVVHYINSFSPTSETFVYDYVTELEKLGVDNHVLTHSRVNSDERPFSKVSVVSKPGKWNIERLTRRLKCALIGKPSFTSDWSQRRDRLEAALREIKPDVIHAHFGTTGVIIAPVANKLGIPLVVHFRGFDISALLRNPFWVRKYISLRNKVDKFIGISKHICRKISNLGIEQEKISKLHTGIRIENFPFDPPLKRYNGKVICCHIGRLVEKKNPVKLVRAFKKAIEVIDSSVEIRLIIAGDGPLFSMTQKEISNLGLNNYVNCIGSIPNRKVIELMRESHLHTKYCETASDGDEEGQGVTFVEASAIGLPIVSTKHNGIPEVVLNGKSGRLVPEGNVKEMGHVIANLAQTPKKWLKMSKNARKHIENNFQLSSQAEKLKKLYIDVCR